MEAQTVRKKRLTYLSIINLLIFCLFFGAVGLFVFSPDGFPQWNIGRTEMEMVMLQSVSFLLLTCAAQLKPKAALGWRPALLMLAFVALSESSLVALLTPAK